MNPRITGRGGHARGSADIHSDSNPASGFLPDGENSVLGTILAQGDLSPWARPRLEKLHREEISGIFWSDLLHLSEEAEKQGELALAAGLFELIQRDCPEASLRERASRAEAALLGQRAGFTDRLEHLSYTWLSEASDPVMLLGMAGAGVAYQGGRVLAWHQLRRFGAGKVLGSWGLRGLSAAGGFLAEVPAFVFTGKAAAQALGREVSWNSEEIREELLASALVLGALKLSSFGGHQVLGQIHGPEALLGVPARLQGWYPTTRVLIPTTATLGGLMGGHHLQAVYQHRESPDFWMNLCDGLATLLQFHGAGKLSPHFFPHLHRANLGLQRFHLEQVRSSEVEIFGSPPIGVQWAWAEASGPAGLGDSAEQFSPLVFMESKEGSGKFHWTHSIEGLSGEKATERRRSIGELSAQIGEMPPEVQWEIAEAILERAKSDVGSVRKAAIRTLPRISRVLTAGALREPWLERLSAELNTSPRLRLAKTLRQIMSQESRTARTYPPSLQRSLEILQIGPGSMGEAALRKLETHWKELGDERIRYQFLVDLYQSLERHPQWANLELTMEKLLDTLSDREFRWFSFRLSQREYLNLEEWNSLLNRMDGPEFHLFYEKMRWDFLTDDRGRRIPSWNLPKEMAELGRRLDTRYLEEVEVAIDSVDPQRIQSQFAGLQDSYDRLWFLKELYMQGRTQIRSHFRLVYEELLLSLEPAERRTLRHELELFERYPNEALLQEALEEMRPEALLELEGEIRSRFLQDEQGRHLEVENIPPRAVMILSEVESRWKRRSASGPAPWLRAVLSNSTGETSPEPPMSTGEPDGRSVDMAESKLDGNPQGEEASAENLISLLGYGKSPEVRTALEEFFALGSISEKGEYLYRLHQKYESDPIFMEVFDELQRRLPWRQQIQISQAGILRFWQSMSPDLSLLFDPVDFELFQSRYDVALQLLLTDTSGHRLEREECLPEVRNLLDRMDQHLEDLKNQQKGDSVKRKSGKTSSLEVGTLLPLVPFRPAPREALDSNDGEGDTAPVHFVRRNRVLGLEPWSHLPLDREQARHDLESMVEALDSRELVRLQEVTADIKDQPWLVAGVSDGLGLRTSLALMASGMMKRGVGVFYELPQLLEWEDPLRLQRMAQAQALAEIAGEFGVDYYLHFTDFVVADSKNGDRTIPSEVLQSLRWLNGEDAVSDLNFFDAIVASKGLTLAPEIPGPIHLPSVDARGRVLMTQMAPYSRRHFRGTLDAMGRNHGLLLKGLTEFFGKNSKTFFPTWAAGSQNFRGLKDVYANSVLGAAKVQAEQDTLRYHLNSEAWDFSRGRHKIVRYPSFLSNALLGIPGAGAFGLISKAVLSRHGLYRDAAQLALRTFLEAYDGTHHWDHPLAALELDAAETAFLPEIQQNLEVFFRRVGEFRAKNPQWEGQALEAAISGDLLEGLVSPEDLPVDP